MTEQAAAGRLPEDSLRVLADPRQEVLIEDRPAFSQLAPVPVLDTDPHPEAPRYQPAAQDHRRD